jgi:hypothetical protein
MKPGKAALMAGVIQGRLAMISEHTFRDKVERSMRPVFSEAAVYPCFTASPLSKSFVSPDVGGIK